MSAISRTRITTRLIALFSGLASAAPAMADGALAVGRTGADAYSGYSSKAVSLAQVEFRRPDRLGPWDPNSTGRSEPRELGSRFQRNPDSTSPQWRGRPTPDSIGQPEPPPSWSQPTNNPQPEISAPNSRKACQDYPSLCR
jgi:hypothetical protein